MADRIQLRRDTAANWTNYNPILLEGEPGIELDTDQWKMGDGIHNWNNLPYRGGPYVQQKGQSTTVAMSQKAVTYEFDRVDGENEEAKNLSRVYKTVNSPSEGPDYSPYVSEVYIIDLPAGECVCKCYNNQVFLYTYNTGVFAKGQKTVNANGIYEIAVYSSDNVDYPYGKTIGYVYINDYVGFNAHSTTNQDAGKINRKYCENVYNSPKIYNEIYANPVTENVDKLYKTVFGLSSNNPQITNSAAIGADGNAYSSGACAIYKEAIPANIDSNKLSTKFNAYVDPSLISYAFYDLVGNIIEHKPSPAGSDSNLSGKWITIDIPEGAVSFANTIAKSEWGLLVPFEYEGVRFGTNIGLANIVETISTEVENNSQSINTLNTEVENNSQSINTLNNEVSGTTINNPQITRSKALSSPSGEPYSSGACDIYTENIPSGTSEFFTKFNSFNAPNNIAYAFYDENDDLIECKPSPAGSDSSLNGKWLSISVPTGAVKFSNSIANKSEYGLIKFDYEGIKFNYGIKGDIAKLDERVTALEAGEDIDYIPELTLPEEIDLIQGEKTLLFKYAMANCFPAKDIVCNNSHCRDYPRYIEINPSVVGETNIKLSAINKDSKTIGEKNIKLNIYSKPNNPQNVLNILVVGSSTTSNYNIIYEELYRRIVLTTGEEDNPSNPKGLGLTNVHFVGRMSNGHNFRYEATGGYSWGNYADPQGAMNNYAFIVSNPSDFAVGAVYTDGTYDFVITEISQSNNRVSANCNVQNAPIAVSGSLTLKSGTSAQTLVYSSYTASITHPFDLGNGVSLSDYMNAYCGGVAPHIIVFQDLVFNGGGILTDAVKGKITSLFNTILSDYPNVKILMSSEALPSAFGGLSYNYASGGVHGRNELMTWRLRKLLVDTIDFIKSFNEAKGSEVVMFVPKTVQCDAEYDYPSTNRDVNYRVTSIDERIDTNGMHPTSNGILNQIDSYYRAIAYCIKKFFN